VRDVVPKLGDLARIRAEGWYRSDARQRRAFAGLVEASALRPALRGTDIAAWVAEPARHVVWSPANDSRPLEERPRLARYLARHADRLRPGAAGEGALQRINEHTFGHKVVWSDLANDLRAAAVEPHARSAAGFVVPVVPLNTVYFLATASRRESLILAAF